MTELSVIETTGEEVEELPAVSAVIRDVQIQAKRLKTIADRIEAGPIEKETAEGTVMEPPPHVNEVTLLRELAHNVFPLMRDILIFVDRLDEHAEWAGEKLEVLLGENEAASQLVPEEADRFGRFLSTCISDFDARLADADPEAEMSKALSAQRDEAQGLLSLVEDLRLQPDGGDDDDDDGEAAPAEA